MNSYIWPSKTQSSKQHVSYNKDCCTSSHVPTDALKVGFQGAENLSRLHGNEKNLLPSVQMTVTPVIVLE